MSTIKNRLILIFLKDRIPGQVKTRVASTMGEEQAVNIYQALVSVLIAQLKWIENTHYRFCYSPPHATESIKNWITPQLLENEQISPPNSTYPKLTYPRPLPPFDFQPQEGADLGERLESAFKHGFAENFQEVCAIGTDCPFLSASFIEKSLQAGRNKDITIGPAHDGGYYLLSLKSFTTAPFRQIPWSTSQTLAATLQNITKSNLSYYTLETLSDIDTEQDWRSALQTTLGSPLKSALKNNAQTSYPT